MLNVLKSEKAQDFYVESLKILNKSNVPFMVGGTFAVNAYLGINRGTKDMDIFCKPSDFPKLAAIFSNNGFKVQVTDERWLGKVFKDKHFFDLIFNSANSNMPVTDIWLKESQKEKIFGTEVYVLPPTELIWSKVFIENRDKYHGNDIAHLILRKSKNIDWKRLLTHMDQYWEVLLVHVLRFRFIYPSEREAVPKWLVDELLKRLITQISLPTSKEKVCHGRLLSFSDFEVDVREWGFTDIYGWQKDATKK